MKKFAHLTTAQLAAKVKWLEAGQHRTAKAGHRHISSLFAGALVTAVLELAERG